MPSSSSIQKNNRPEKWPRKHFRITPQWRQWFFKLYLKCVQPYITSIGLLWYSIQAPNFKLFLILSIFGKLYVSCLSYFSVDTINHPDLREKGIFFWFTILRVTVNHGREDMTLHKVDMVAGSRDWPFTLHSHSEYREWTGSWTSLSSLKACLQ